MIATASPSRMYSDVQAMGKTMPGGVSAGFCNAIYQALSLPDGTARPDAKPSSRISGTVNTAQRRNDIRN